MAINKIDRVEAPVLLGLTREMNERFDFAETFLISAEKGHGVQDLLVWLGEQMPEGPWLYPEDQIADLPLRMIAAEITREKLTLRLHQELPYQLTVETEGWEDRKDGSVRIDQVIYVARDGHKGIVLGKKLDCTAPARLNSRCMRLLIFSRLCCKRRRDKWVSVRARTSSTWKGLVM